MSSLSRDCYEHKQSLIKSNDMFAEYKPQLLKWRAFNASDLNGLELPTSMRDKPYLLKDPYQEIDIPEVHKQPTVMFRLADFCVLPSECSDDARLSGLDPTTGSRLELTTDQRKSLRRTGELDVPSRTFPGQRHTWQVAREVYSGIETIQADFKVGFGAALDQVVYAADAAVSESTTSVFSAIKRFRKVLSLISDGMTQFFRSFDTRLYSDRTIDLLVKEARESFVRKRIQEIEGVNVPMALTGKHYSYYEYHAPRSDDSDCSSQMWDAIKNHGEWQDSEPPSKEEFAAAKVVWETFHRWTLKMKRAGFEPKIATSLEKEVSARISPIAAKRLQKENHDEAAEAKQKHWVESLLTVDDIPFNFRENEVNKCKARTIREDIKKSDEAAAARIAKDRVSKDNSWMSYSPAYRSKQEARHQVTEMRRLQTTVDERFIDSLKQAGLGTQALKLTVALEFERVHAPKLRQKLKSSRVPLNPAKFEIMQFNPENWKKSGNTFYRYKKVLVDLGKPLWRIRYTSLVFWSSLKWCIGGSSHFLLNGPLSLRALLSKEPYYAISRPLRDPSTLTPTLTSRLKTLFDNLASRKLRFENEPDSGIVPKAVSRFFFTVQLVVEGCVGTVLTVLSMVAGTLLSLVVCLSLFLGSPVIAFALASVVLAFQFILVDTVLMRSSDQPVGTSLLKNYPKRYVVAPVIKLCLLVPLQVTLGVAELLFAAIRIAAIHPVLFLARLMVGSTRLLFRITRDSCTWPLLKSFAMVPATSKDTWLAKRVLGPGVSSEFYNRLPIEGAQAAVIRSLERDRMSAHQTLREREMNAPYHDYINMFNVSAFGLRTAPLCESPTASVKKKISKQRTKRRSRRAQLKGLDIQNEWETFALRVRQLDQGYSEVLDTLEAAWREAHERDIETRSITYSRHPVNSDAEPVSGSSPLDQLVNRTHLPLSNFISNVASLQELLQEMIELPELARGSFRMTAEEIESLWQFTIAAVEDLQQLLKVELLLVVSESQWLSRKDAESLIDNFTTESVAVKAFRLLTSILDERSLTESLEDLDESFVFEKGNHVMIRKQVPQLEF